MGFKNNACMIDHPLNGKPLVDPAGGGQTVAQCRSHVPRSRSLAGDERLAGSKGDGVCWGGRHLPAAHHLVRLTKRTPGVWAQSHGSHIHAHTPAAFNSVFNLTQFRADKNQECFITLSWGGASVIYAIKHHVRGEDEWKQTKAQQKKQ